VVDTSQSVRDASCSGVATDDESVLSEAAAFTEGAMDAASQEKYNRFFRWMLANGAEFSNLILKQYAPGHRGLLARRNIPPNHTFMSIPRALLITRELCLSSNIGQRLSRYDMETEEMVIAAFLLQERDDSNSKWQPYISSLPEDFSFMPVFYSNEFIAKWLKGSVAVGKIRECQKLLRTEYTQLCRVTLQWSFEEFAWASLVVLTRQFCITVEGEETTALVPLADLLNHKRPKESVWDYSDHDGGTFIVTSLVDIKKSHQIFDSYGCKCNSRLLVNYGFAVHENINTEAMFRLGLDQTDPLFPDHRKLLGMDELDIAITIEYAAAASRRCFAWLRIALANTLDVAALTAAAKGKAWIDDERSVLPLGRVNEIDVLRVLQIAARHALLAFDCSVEEDDQLLAEGGLDHLVGEDREKIDAVRNCIVVRRGEKQVVYIHFFRFFLHFLHVNS
jgi:histone-lysine N-methyltransferase SETD3